MIQAQIARYLNVSEAVVSKWKKVSEQGGPEALQARKGSGRLPKLSAADKDKLFEKLQQGAIAAEFPTEQWMQARGKQVIEREFGVQYH